tara:strand:- start:6272 stop:8656 length:2385 start_codon:yes stop_codon:yes gene_type:complete
MARVPELKGPSVAPAPLPNAFQTSNATVASFGGAEAASMISAGQQISQAGDVLAQMALQAQSDDNDRELKDLQANWRTQLLQINYGDGESLGFQQLRGQAALDAEEAARNNVENLRTQLLDQASNQAVYDVFSDYTAEASVLQYEKMFKHVMAERITANVDSINNSLAAGVNEVAVDPSAAYEVLGMIDNNAISMANMEGWALDGPEIEIWKATQADTMVTAMVNGALSRQQPHEANDLFREFAQHMGGVARTQLAASLQQVTLEAGAQEYVDDLQLRFPGDFEAQYEAAKNEMEFGAERTAAVNEITARMAMEVGFLKFHADLRDFAEDVESDEAEDASLIDVRQWINSGVPQTEAEEKVEELYGDNLIVYEAYMNTINTLYGRADAAKTRDTKDRANADVIGWKSSGVSMEQALIEIERYANDSTTYDIYKSTINEIYQLYDESQLRDAEAGAQQWLADNQDLSPVELAAKAEEQFFADELNVDVYKQIVALIGNAQTLSNNVEAATNNEASKSLNTYIAETDNPVYNEWAALHPEYADALIAAGLKPESELLVYQSQFATTTDPEMILKYLNKTVSDLQRNGQTYLTEARTLLTEAQYNVLLSNVLAAEAQSAGVVAINTDDLNRMLNDTFKAENWNESRGQREEIGRVSLEVHRQFRVLESARKGTPILQEDVQAIIDNVMGDINVGGSWYTLGLASRSMMSADALQYNTVRSPMSGFTVQSEVYKYVIDLHYHNTGDDGIATVPDVQSAEFDRQLVAVQLFYDEYSETPISPDDWAEAEAMAAQELDED